MIKTIFVLTGFAIAGLIITTTSAPLLIPVFIAGAAVVACGLFVFQRFVLRVHPVRVLWHLATGHHLDGKDRCLDRTWWRSGTRPAGRNNRKHLSWISRRARAHRAIAFWVIALSVMYLPAGILSHPVTTAWVLKGVAGAVVLYLLWRVLRWLARRSHRRTMVNPVATALASHLGQSAAVVAEHLRIKPGVDFQPGDVVAMIKRLPDHYAANMGDRDWVENLLSSRIPVELEYDWQTTRYPMRLVARCASAPPPQFTLDQALDKIGQLGLGQYLIGMSANEAYEVWDANTEDPALMTGGRSRRGKTNVNLAIIGQGLRRGERFTAIDPKRVSLTCLAGVPGFTLANDPRDVPAMWKAIHDFREAMDDAIDGLGDGVPQTLVLEEVNQLFALFRAHWDQVKPVGARIGDLPAWLDIKAVLHQGAQFGFRVIVDGQDLNAAVLFGSRHSFGTILMTGFTPKQWSYAVGTSPIPASPNRKGRFHLVRGTSHTTVQVVIADPSSGEANERAWREFALSGKAGTPPGPQDQDGDKLPPRQQALPTGAIPLAISHVLIGPKQAAAYLGITVDAFKMARRRYPIDGEFKSEVNRQDVTCWTPETLQLWVRDRAA